MCNTLTFNTDVHVLFDGAIVCLMCLVACMLCLMVCPVCLMVCMVCMMGVHYCTSVLCINTYMQKNIITSYYMGLSQLRCSPRQCLPRGPAASVVACLMHHTSLLLSSVACPLWPWAKHFYGSCCILGCTSIILHWPPSLRGSQPSISTVRVVYWYVLV